MEENDLTLNEIDLNNKSYEEMIESLILSIKSFETEADFKSVISIIDEYIDKVDEKDKSKILSYKLRSLYKLNDYNELLKEVVEALKVTTDKNEIAYILFYESMAYEAMGEIVHSIESLNKIVDNIPKTELTNKYLKLSMLYIKNNQFNEAKEAYNYASKIDYLRKNNMFDLVESDLFYLSNKFNEALESYLKFFLKSPNKYKYLDRYILINIKLNKLNDALDFYNQYKDKIEKYVSDQYSLSFFEASKELINLLSLNEEKEYINSKIDNKKVLYSNKDNELNEDSVLSLINSMSYPLTKYDKRKNIVNRLIKNLNIELIYYIYEAEDGISFNRFDGIQSRETIIKYSVLKESNILDDFIIESDRTINYFYNEKLERIDNSFNVLCIKNDLYNFGYLVIKGDNNYLYNALRGTLLEIFIRLESILKDNNINDSLLESLALKELGFIKITSLNVELYNSYTKNIFNTRKDFIDFLDFKDYFMEDLYLDDLVKLNNYKAKMMIDNYKRIFDFDFFTINDNLYAFVKDITDTYKDDLDKENYYTNSSLQFFNENKLIELIHKVKESFSIMGLSINYLESKDSLNIKIDKLNKMYDFLSKISNTKNIFYIGENHYLIMLETVDKRNLESLYTRIEKNIYSMYKYSFSLRDNKITGFASKSLKNKSKEEVFSLIEYGFSYSSRICDFVVLDNDEKKAYSLFRTFEHDIIEHIKNSDLNIVYLPVVKEINKEIHYLIPNYASLYDFNYQAIEQIISYNDIETISDELILNKVIENKNKYNTKFKYIISLHNETLRSEATLKRIIDKINKFGLNNVIILKVDKLLDKALNLFKENNILLAKEINNINELSLDLYDVLFLKLDEENNINTELINLIKNVFNKDVIIDSSFNSFNSELTIKRRTPYTVQYLIKFN